MLGETPRFSGEIEQLDPQLLLTQESIVYEAGLGEVDLHIPISFGRDENNVAYVTDGNHRAYLALLTDGVLLGIQICRMQGSVIEDEDFHPLADLRLVPSIKPSSLSLDLNY